MADITMMYGAYQLKPAPIISLQKELVKAGNQEENIGATFRLTMRGTLTPFPDSQIGGLDQIDALQDELRDAFSVDGRHLELTCGATTILSVCPRILSVAFDESSNNWVMTAPYTIEVEFDQDDQAEDSAMPPFIESYDESWQVEMEQERRHFSLDLTTVTDQDGDSDYVTDSNAPFIVRVTHNVAVKGKRTFSCVGTTGDMQGEMTPAAENALQWINGGYFLPAESETAYVGTYAHALSGVLNMDSSDFTPTDHFRSSNVNETDGTVNMTETWIIVGETGINKLATEDFDISIRTGLEPLHNVTINGTIKGYVEQSYGDPESTTDYTVDVPAYDNAIEYWDTIKTRLFSRAQYAYQHDNDLRLNPRPVTNSVGHSPSNGVITYTYEYDNRPCLMISGALTEDINITDNYPTDVFASIPVIGRPSGPVLQAMSTVTSATREINIDVTMPLPTGCSSIADLNLYDPSTQVADLICEFETELTDNNDQVFLTENQKVWNPKTGRFSRRVSWVVGSCDGDITTSFC